MIRKPAHKVQVVAEAEAVVEGAELGAGVVVGAHVAVEVVRGVVVEAGAVVEAGIVVALEREAAVQVMVVMICGCGNLHALFHIPHPTSPSLEQCLVLVV